MPLSVISSKEVERATTRSDDCNPNPEEDLETMIEVIRIPSTKTNGINSSRLSYSPDGSRDSESQQTTTDTKEKKTKWKKLKTGLSRSTKTLGSRLKPGGGRSQRNVVQEICILPSTGLNGECFGDEEEKKEKEKGKEGGRTARGGRRRGGRGGGHQRSGSDDSLVFASRTDSATSTNSRTSLPPPVDRPSNSVDSSLVIYDADYDGRL